jgi:hypothetical protein
MNFLVRCGALSLLSQKSNGKVSLPPTLPKDAEFTLNPHREQAAPQQNAFDIAISPASEPPLSLRVFRNRLDVCTISFQSAAMRGCLLLGSADFRKSWVQL